MHPRTHDKTDRLRQNCRISVSGIRPWEALQPCRWSPMALSSNPKVSFPLSQSVSAHVSVRPPSEGAAPETTLRASTLLSSINSRLTPGAFAPFRNALGGSAGRHGAECIDREQLGRAISRYLPVAACRAFVSRGRRCLSVCLCLNRACVVALPPVQSTVESCTTSGISACPKLHTLCVGQYSWA